jgi:hypothetical protein
MRLIAVFNLPVILLALVVGAIATPLGEGAGRPSVMDEGLSDFAPLHLYLFNPSTGDHSDLEFGPSSGGP